MCWWFRKKKGGKGIFKKRENGKKILILTTAIFLINFESICLAENNQEAEDEAVDLGSIVITASKTEKHVSEVSSGVSIIEQEAIESSNAKSVPDLLKGVEGVYTYDGSGVGTTGRVNMRGFWGGMSTYQLVLIDGIPQNKGEDKLVDWNLISLNNIERIEIIKGPASALYGDNATSGVINIITKRPSLTPQTKIFASYGSYDTQKYEIATSGTFKKLGYYLNISKKSTEGFRKHCDYGDINLDGKLDFSINEKQNIKLSLGFCEEKIGAYPWAITEAQIKEDRRQARVGTENDHRKIEDTAASLTYKGGINEICDIKGTFYYRYRDNKAFYTPGATENSTQEQVEKENTYGLIPQLNRGAKIFGMSHLFTAGVDLEENNFDYEEYAAPFQVRGRLRSDYNVKRKKVGPYIQDEIKLFEPLSLTLGARYDLIKFDFDNYEDESNSEKRDMSKVSPKFGMVYNYQELSNIYVNYAWAFRTPTLGQMFTYGSFSNPNLNPEEAINYEIGIRHQFNDSLKANLSLYWMNLDNEIWYDSTVKQYKNYGKTSHAGVETGLNFNIIESLGGFINYAYSRAKNESGAYKGKYLMHVPIHKGGLGAIYEPDCGLKVNLTVTGMGDSYMNSANTGKLTGFVTADAKIGYGRKWWEVFVGVDNIFDKKYNSYGYETSRGVKYFNPAPGTMFTVGAEAKF